MERGWGGGVFDSLLFDLQHGHVLKKLPFEPTLRVGGGGGLRSKYLLPCC